MAVIKLSSSGKQLQFITDEGDVFGTSRLFVEGLFNGKSPRGFIMLTKMPFKVAKNRFKPSPVYNPESGEKEVSDVNLNTDALAKVQVKKRKEDNSFREDIKEW